jgi:hypothetical protein
MMEGVDIEQLQTRRLRSWCQDGEHRVPDPEAAKQFIQRHGLVTHYAASAEVPNLYDAYMSEPKAKLDASWDSPSGHVYVWRWDIGKSLAAFYGALVAKKPTWIAWDVLPLVLGFGMERRDPEDLYVDGLLSNDAIRIVRAFEGAGGVLSTKELRKRAGFPTGKPERAAYLKAVEELDTRLLLAKVFDSESAADDMNHALIGVKYAGQVAEAVQMTPSDALGRFLDRYLSQSFFIDPRLFAKHLRIPSPVMDKAVEDLVKNDVARRVDGWLVTANFE